MSVFLTAAGLVGGLALLVKGGDWLVTGATGLARRAGVSDLAAGLTVVAFGTSMPELTVSLLAGARDANAVSVGNVVGSNICNILLILGATALIYPLSATSSTIWREIPFILLASVLLVVLAADMPLDGAAGNLLSRGDGLALLCVFGVFLYYVGILIRSARPEELEASDDPPAPLPKSVVYMVLGLTALVGGGHFTVQSAVSIATAAGVSEFLIGVTVVAVGTSLPELAASAVAAFKKNADIAVGNVVGSNIFNILLILGLSSTVNPIPFGTESYGDLAVMVVATVLLFVAMFTGRPRHQIQRGEGALFLAVYVGYLVWVVMRG